MRAMATVTDRPRNDPAGPGGPPEPPGLRPRAFLPRSVGGIVALLVATSIGAAFSGTILFAYYQYRLQKTETRVEKFIADFDKTLKDGVKTVHDERDAAKAEIRKELEPLQEIRAQGGVLKDMVSKVKDSVYLVQTQDEVGQPSVGTAFVVTADADQSYLVTSLAVVQASTKRPGPEITIRKGNETPAKATLWTWQEERDLALLIVPRGNLPRLPWAAAGATPDIGERVFTVAGIGGAGASIVQGFVADVSAAGLEHDTAISGAFVGGPVLNSKGEVLGVASRTYAPLGFVSDRVTFAVPIRSSCERVLKCPAGNNANAPGGKRP
jgi:S1-C subfamily serine protease